MKHAEIIAYGVEGRLAETLAEWAAKRGFTCRPVRFTKACGNLARRNPASVVVLKIGRDLDKELTLLERLTMLYPEAPCVVVGDGANPELAGLCWDLGARYVLFPPQPLEKLPAILDGFLPSTIARSS